MSHLKNLTFEDVQEAKQTMAGYLERIGSKLNSPAPSDKDRTHDEIQAEAGDKKVAKKLQGEAIVRENGSLQRRAVIVATKLPLILQQVFHAKIRKGAHFEKARLFLNDAVLFGSRFFFGGAHPQTLYLTKRNILNN